MTAPAISIRGLGKRYRVNHAVERAPYRTLRDSLVRLAAAPLRRLRGTHSATTEDFWALKDVSFDVWPGEVVGIIGRNGAGKSTLLKVLSRITNPTIGEVEINGRVGSLLEVGTGFHPELTGRENIYLNGSILGMSRREISRQFDEIVDFSGVEKFLDTPVKRFSSGMYVRLAFAVAAHLDPEILIVDEVLAVGDAEFQRKCTRRMREISEAGRTVLFVSHNMPAIANLCQSAVLLADGGISAMGDAPRMVESYVASLARPDGGYVSLRRHPSRGQGCVPLISAVRFLNDRNQVTNTLESGAPLTVALALEPVVPLLRAEVGIGFNDAMGQRVFSVATYLSDCELGPVETARTVYCTIASLDLAPGRYTLSLSAGTTGHYLMDALEDAVAIEVATSDFYGNGRLPIAGLGQVLVRSRWSVDHS